MMVEHEAELATMRAERDDARRAVDDARRRAIIAECAQSGAERREHEARTQAEALWERALRAEGEVVGWMGAFGRLVDALARECAK